MNKKRVYVSVIIALAFLTNLVPSLLYLNIKMTMMHLFVSVATLCLLVLLTAKQRAIVFLGGALAGLLIYLINLTVLSDARLNFAVLDVILSVEYPLYLLFVTPLFGFNYVFSLDYPLFTLLLAALFGLLYIIEKVLSYTTLLKVDS